MNTSRIVPRYIIFFSMLLLFGDIAVLIAISLKKQRANAMKNTAEKAITSELFTNVK